MAFGAKEHFQDDPWAQMVLPSTLKEYLTTFKSELEEGTWQDILKFTFARQPLEKQLLGLENAAYFLNNNMYGYIKHTDTVDSEMSKLKKYLRKTLY